MTFERTSGSAACPVSTLICSGEGTRRRIVGVGESLTELTERMADRVNGWVRKCMGA